MLLGWEGVRTTEFTGSLTPMHVERVSAMAERHGLQLADYRRVGAQEAEPNEVEYAITT